MVLMHGAVWTANPRQPKANAVAVADGRILAVGTSAEMRELIGPGTKIIDLKEKSLLPGFIDSHIHFTQGGFHLLSVDLRNAGSETEFAQRIKAKAATLPKGQWLLGGDWDHESWPGAQLPTRASIDSYTQETPVFVSRLDGHMGLANSRALRLAGIKKGTPDPPGGLIVRDSKTGEPTGILKDAAMDLMHHVIPDPTEAQRMEAAQAALAEARRLGVTSVHDMSAAQDLAVYQKLLKTGELTCRINAFVPLPEWRKLAVLGIQAGFGGEMIKIGGLKGFADGSLGSTTALFFEPYTDSPQTSGLPNAMMIPEENMKRMIAGADKAGLQVVVHAIGDKANHIILNQFKQVTEEEGSKDRRFRIEHAQHIHPKDIERFASLHVIASMQPYHVIDDGRWAEKRIGPVRCQTTYAFRKLLDSGAKLAFGSDWPVAPMSPILGIYAAVTRRTLDGKNPGGWIPQEKITTGEALQAYTATAAYAGFEEGIKGSLEPGKVADMVVLSGDLFGVPLEKIQDLAVVYTFVNGRLVYEKK